MPQNRQNWNDQKELRADLERRFSTSGVFRQKTRRVFRGVTWLVFVRSVAALKRALDLVVSLLLLLLLSPLFLFLALTSSPGGLQGTEKLGRWCAPYKQLAFRSPEGKLGRILRKTHLLELPVLFNILKGEMSFVGPRAASIGEMSLRERAVRRRYNVRPGLISLWWIRRRANIAYGSEVDSDAEYIESQTVWGDLGIALRAVPALVYGEGVPTAPDTLTLLGVPIDNLTMQDTLEKFGEWLQGSDSHQVCFVNADCANIAFRNQEYLSLLKQADLVLADGIGLKLGGKLLGQDIKQNVNGTDLFPRLCALLAATGDGVFLLGARPGVAHGVREWIRRHHPKTVVSGLHHGYYGSDEEGRVIQEIANSGARVLLVAFGVPRQDLWIGRNLANCGVRIAMGVGGLFDFYSGRIPRAPQWLREIGMEWVYRMYQEPRRMWRRYLWGNTVFLSRVLRERWTGPRTSF